MGVPSGGQPPPLNAQKLKNETLEHEEIVIFNELNQICVVLMQLEVLIRTAEDAQRRQSRTPVLCSYRKHLTQLHVHLCSSLVHKRTPCASVAAASVSASYPLLLTHEPLCSTFQKIDEIF